MFVQKCGEDSACEKGECIERAPVSGTPTKPAQEDGEFPWTLLIIFLVLIIAGLSFYFFAIANKKKRDSRLSKIAFPDFKCKK